jgi:hypothetical protein
MCGEDDYMLRMLLDLPTVEKPEKYSFVISEALYDRLTQLFGQNCGYDPRYITVIRGLPKFDI